MKEGFLRDSGDRGQLGLAIFLAFPLPERRGRLSKDALAVNRHIHHDPFCLERHLFPIRDLDWCIFFRPIVADLARKRKAPVEDVIDSILRCNVDEMTRGTAGSEGSEVTCHGIPDSLAARCQYGHH